MSHRQRVQEESDPSLYPSTMSEGWKWLQVMVALTIFSIASWQIYLHAKEMIIPNLIAPNWLIVAIIAQIGVSLGNSNLTWRHLRHSHIHPSFLSLWKVNAWGSFANLVLPFGMGVLIRGMWLKKQHQMSTMRVGQHILEVNLLVFLVNLTLLDLILLLTEAGAWWQWMLLATLPLLILRIKIPIGLLTAAMIPYPFIVLGYLALNGAFSLGLPQTFLLLLPLLVHASAVVMLAPGSLLLTESLFIVLALASSVPLNQALWLAITARGSALIAILILLAGLHLYPRIRPNRLCND